MNILELKNVGLDYYQDNIKVEVLKNINLQIDEGEFIGIIGRSGAGKSSLLYVMSCLERPTYGEVVMDGNIISKYSNDKLADLRLKDFGFVFQFYNLSPILSVEENIALPLHLDKKNIVDYKDKIDMLLEEFDLTNKRNFKPSQLSGGQQQRVAIARAIINNPKVIFADEPTGNLDSKSSLDVINLLHKLNKQYNKTVIMVTHNEDLCQYTSRIIRMEDGHII